MLETPYHQLTIVIWHGCVNPSRLNAASIVSRSSTTKNHKRYAQASKAIGPTSELHQFPAQTRLLQQLVRPPHLTPNQNLVYSKRNHHTHTRPAIALASLPQPLSKHSRTPTHRPTPSTLPHTSELSTPAPQPFHESKLQSIETQL